MITFKNNGANCTIRVEEGPLNTAFIFEFNNTNQFYAELLKDHFNRNMHQKLSDIRREAYNEGWRDAKAKKHGRKTWFSGLWK